MAAIAGDGSCPALLPVMVVRTDIPLGLTRWETPKSLSNPGWDKSS